MKLQLYLLLTLPLLLISAFLFPQSGRLSIAKEPAWVSKNTINYNKTSLDKDATDGYIDISYERQIYLADKSQYVRRSKKIISQAGVQNGSQVSVSFDPSYEQLIFHSVYIVRKGEILNRLKLNNIKTVHQETELSNFIYNGSLDAIMILDDVRAGDIIEYSYTRKGFNPIFKNKYTDEYSMKFSFPLYEIFYKLIVPAGRKMTIKNLNDTLQPVTSVMNGQQVYEWHKSNIACLALQDFTPSWYDPYPQVLVSEFNSWKEVNDWAMELFPVKKALSPALLKKIAEFEKDYTGDEERTKAALRFVQDDIRYMGIEMGENSHKPADPSRVFAQRFGDCKEKSYLLCCMLRAMNINAAPVLINTASKNYISSLLPAPTDFDHCTVRVKINNDYFWFDPTIAYQRGSLKNLFYPDYQAGLVIADSTTLLTPIAFRNTSSEHVKEYFKVSSMSGGGSLIVTTTFRGGVADDARYDINNESISGLMTTYQKFYAAYYEDIKADSLTYADDDSTGTFTTTEYYSIPDFWTTDKESGKKFSFSSFVISSVLRRPKEKDRKMPFRLMYPAKYREELVVDLPKDWRVTESETHLKNKCFAYNYKFYCVSNHVHLETDYENFKDHATIEDTPAYFKDLTTYDDIGNFELSSGTDITARPRTETSGNNTWLLVLLIGVFLGGAIWWTQRR